MARRYRQMEHHVVGRLGWLRAAVLGANDGLLSTSSLIIGVASAQGSHGGILIAGIAALVAGAMSMAAGEYVSVSSQADSERADIAREAAELRDHPAGEAKELAGIYVKRGLDKALATEVAQEMMAHDPLAAHVRDELGISATIAPRPVQAALASAASFSLGAAAPLALVLVTPHPLILPSVAVGSLLFLALLGVAGAQVGGANVMRAVIRVTCWGALAMLVTAAVGALSGTQV